ncbi:MAG: carbohydrate ABC transporter permease [Sumerlaeia bacterium]
MKKPPAPSPSYENNMSKVAQIAAKAGLFAILLPMLLLVLLPLFWMILTAFKVPGTAFKLQFIPQTYVYTPSSEFPPLSVAELSATTGWLHLEYTDAQTTTVEAIITSPDGETTQKPLSRVDAELWTLDHGPLDVMGDYRYQFVVGGNAPIADPKMESFAEPFSTLTVVAGEIAHAPEARLLAYALPMNVEGIPYTIQYFGGPEKTFSIQPLKILQPDSTATSTASEEINSPQQADSETPALPQPNPKFESAGEFIPLLEGPAGPAGLYMKTPSTAGNPPYFSHYRIAESISFAEATARLYTLENFKAILTNPSFNFAGYFFNSLVVAAGTGFLTVLICTLAGYAFVRIPFHYRDRLFIALLASMLVPGMIYMVPQFSITLQLGLMDSYGGMIIPHLANVFGLFLMKQYIEQIPSDVFSAAEIDGAKDYQIFLNVVIPMCLPIIVTLFLLTFVGQWSNFLWQLIVNTGDSEVLTLPVGLQQFKGQNANEWEKIMAGACFSLIPIAVLFLFLQRYFLDAVAAGSVKE